MKTEKKRITIRLHPPQVEKLDRLAKKITPKGSPPNPSLVVRNLIEKEKE